MLAPAVAGACTPQEITRTEVRRGDACVVGYFDTKAPQYVGSGTVVDLGGGIIRQTFSNGVCGMGERVVAYFDCATRTGAWLGGPASGNGSPPVPVIDGAPVIGPDGYSIADAFVDREEKRLPNGPRPADVLARIRAMQAVSQSGAIESPRMTVDGKRFDLNCGCKLFYPNGVN